MAPKTEAQLENLRKTRRKKILEAALELFAMNGFRETSISNIAKKANISKGLVYNYFQNKESILEAIIEGAMQEGEKILDENTPEDPKASLKQIFEAFFEEIKKNQQYWKLITSLGLRMAEFPRISQLIKDRLNQYIEIIKKLFQDAGIPNPEEEAWVVGATFDGITLHFLLEGKEYPLDKVKNFLIDKYTKF